MSLRDAFNAEHTLIFGHRGASHYAPMNTIPAFEMAAELGADGVELDVHRSVDGHAVVVHDFTVDATTDGTGEVAQMTLADLRNLDAGSWKASHYAGVRIPTLDEVFEAIGQRLFINVEIKSTALRSDGIEQLVADGIRRHNLVDRVVVSSFNPLALRRFHRVLPEALIGYLVSDELPFFVGWFAIGMTYHAYHPNERMLTPALIEKYKARGHWINTWTVNDPARARALAALKLDALITDQPDVIREALDA
jgi:glycerophosphoryl diester phosphodiesterase